MVFVSRPRVSTAWEDAVRWLADQPDYQQVVRDCYYDQPTHLAALRYVQSEEWQAAAVLIGSASGRALDLGAGHGITSVALARLGFQVVAVEPDPSNLVGRGAISRASATLGLGIEVLDGTAESIPAEAAAFDFVLARAVLHHTANLSAACREIFRVLRPGGRFFSLRDHVISRQSDLRPFQDSHPLHRLYGGENAYTEREYRVALRDAGFEFDRVLRSFDSVINFAPRTRSGLGMALASRVRRIPFASAVVSALVGSDALFDGLLRLMSLLDGRPGRLVSVLSRRPEST
jgi:SAM-dependent methyltransferase